MEIQKLIQSIDKNCNSISMILKYLISGKIWFVIKSNFDAVLIKHKHILYSIVCHDDYVIYCQRYFICHINVFCSPVIHYQYLSCVYLPHVFCESQHFKMHKI